MIKNDALLNEEMDPRLMVEKLKRDIVLLKEELAMATGEQRTDALSQEEIDRCVVLRLWNKHSIKNTLKVDTFLTCVLSLRHNPESIL